jgi:two-component system phosphate regulon sensor histidine kinase PhoR
MAPHHVPKIFNRFYRIDEARASAIEGAGLGLSIVKRMADLQKIDIAVHSVPGEGTTFRLAFRGVVHPGTTF